MEQKERLTYSGILVFWLPLALTWLMMAFEGPFLAAIIARMNDPKYNLAAYGVSFAFAMLVESPIIMMMSASTALVRDRQSYVKLRNYSFFLNIVISLVMLVLVMPPVFSVLSVTVLKLPGKVADLMYLSLIFLFPWPAAIGFRRFYQGILIKYNQTRYVAYGTSVRIITVLVAAMCLFIFTELEGAYIGSISLSLAVCFEALATRYMADGIVRRLLNSQQEASPTAGLPLSYNGINSFYFPLALTAILMIGINPMTTFFLGWSRNALESLAVFPVIGSLVFIFRSIAVSFQEVGIALMNNSRQNYRMLRNFALLTGSVLMSGLGLIAVTPLSRIWFHSISGLSLELTQFTTRPMLLMVVIPGLTVLLSFQRALLVVTRRTTPITIATFLELVCIGLVLYGVITRLDLIGATAAAMALLLGRLVSTVYLLKPSHEVMTHLS